MTIPTMTSMMVSFSPSFRGNHTCMITVVDDVAGVTDNTLAVTGDGEGAAILLAPVGTITFPGQRISTTASAMMMTITNNGDPGYDLDVTSVTKTGGAAGDYTLGGFSGGAIPQGMSQNVTITFTPSATGTRNATLTVNTSEASAISATKNVTGTGTQALLVPNPTTVNIGNVRINGTTSANGTTQMTNPGTATVQVTNLALSGGQVGDFALVSPPSLPHNITAGNQTGVTVRCDPSAIGLRSTTLVITSDDDGPSPDNVTANCTGTRSYVSMSSVAEINFGDVLVGTTGSSPLIVSNLNNANVVSLNGTITATPSMFSSTATTISNLVGGGAIPFDVQFLPTTDGTVTGTLTVATDDPVTPTITITLTGRGVRPAGLDVTPDAFNFGDVGIGNNVLSPPFVVDSIGDGVLNVGSLTVAGPHAGNFSVANDQCSGQAVPNGDFCGFAVRYTPSGSGPRHATVTIPSDAPDSPHSVEVTGTSGVLFIDGFET